MSNGPLMLDLQGLSVLPEEREMLAHPATGGVILFSRNYQSPEQLEQLVAEIQNARSPHLLIAVDQEGGRVQRFREKFSELPPLAVFGTCYQQNKNKARELASDVAWLMASELRAHGIDFSFAPVLDIDYGVSGVIGNRAFSRDTQAIADLAFSWSKGAREAGMASVGKHFPGHGAVEADSHLELPIDERDFDTIWMNDLFPFRHLIQNNLEGIMPAHVIYSSCDARPAGYSEFWIKEILRQRMQFSGVIFSDDLSMEGANFAGGYEDRANMALQAGCDMILVCNNPEGAAQTLDALSDYHDPVSQSRLVRMHGKGELSMDQVRENPRWASSLRHIDKLSDDHTIAMEFQG